jgi:hypothetical protein
LGGIAEEVERLGVSLVAIGNGTVDQARQFKAERQLPFELYVDPGLRAYGALGLLRGVGATLNPNVFRSAWRAVLGGHLQGATQGDPWQQGGAFLVLPNGTMPYAFRGDAAGDHPDTAELLAAVRAAASST